ncbi:MAG: hypothetical protein IID36_00830 [Planctomycetes bacterium]|nr:hypothetical protein [Planctomycetota bacterium]
MSLIVAVISAFVVYTAWHMWQTEPPPPPVVRGLADVDLDWKCATGHRFRAKGQLSPRHCPRCAAEAEIVDRYDCVKHGSIEVAVRIEIDPAGVAVPGRFRIGDGDWAPAGEGPVCPHCQKLMRRPRRDPLDGRTRAGRRAPP